MTIRFLLAFAFGAVLVWSSVKAETDDSVIVMWVGSLQSLYILEPKTQFGCHAEAMQSERDMKAKFPGVEFIAACLKRSEVFKKEKA